MEAEACGVLSVNCEPGWDNCEPGCERRQCGITSRRGLHLPLFQDSGEKKKTAIISPNLQVAGGTPDAVQTVLHCSA
jgi:hypothetical protein